MLTKRRAPLAMNSNTSALWIKLARTALDMSVMTLKRAHHAKLGRLLNLGRTLTEDAKCAMEQRLVKTG